MPLHLEINSPSFTQEDLYKISFENAAVGIAHINKEGYFVKVNKKVTEITGFSEEELIMQKFQEVTISDAVDENPKQADALVDRVKNAYTIEKRYVRKNGSLIWIKISGSAIFGAGNEFLMFVAIIENITEEKNTEEQLKEKSEQLIAMLDSITDCYISLDKNWKILEVNKEAERKLFEIPAKELIGKVFWNLYPKGYGDIFHREYEKAFNDNIPVHFEAHSNVADKWLEVHAFPRKAHLEIFFRDITGRKQLEDALLKSEKKFADLFFNSPAFTVISDIETGDIIEMNEAYSKITGYTREELIGKNLIELGLFTKESRNKSAKEIIKNQKMQLAEVQIYDRHKEIHSLLFSATTIMVNEKNYFLTSGIDVTQLKKAEEALHKNEQHYKIASAAANIGSYWRDLQSGEDYWSPEILKIFGLKTTDAVLLKDGIPEAVHPDDRELVLNMANQFYKRSDKQEFNCDHRIILPDGTVRWINVRGIAEHDSMMNPAKIFGIAMDITERKVAEEALSVSEANFRLLANNMSQLAWMMDKDGWVFWYNQRYLDYTGLSIEELQGWDWKKVHHPDHIDRVVESKKQAIASGKVWEELFPLRNNEGKYCWFLTRAIPVKDDKGIVIRWLGTNTDVTEQRNVENKLKSDNKVFEDLLYIAAHDLKGPVANMYGALNLMESLPLEKKIKFLEQFRSLADQLNITIRGVTDILRMRNNEKSAVTTICLETILDKILLELNTDRSSVKFRFEKSDIHYIEIYLYSILKNLISNSIKYSRENVPLTIEIASQAKEEYTLLTVRDNGVGIDLERYGKQLFAPFQRINSRKVKGTGIGLYLIKDIIEKNGGFIEVDSFPGEGTTFYCYLKEY